MRVKLLAGCGFLLNTIFFATYYSVAKEALGRIDPIIFTFFEMTTLVPAALIILFCSRKSQISQRITYSYGMTSWSKTRTALARQILYSAFALCPLLT